MLSVEKEPRRFLTPQHKFIERPEEAHLLEVSGQALCSREFIRLAPLLRFRAAEKSLIEYFIRPELAA